MTGRGISKLVAAVIAAGVIGAMTATGAVWALHQLHPPPGDLHSLLHRVLPLDAAERARLDAKEQVFVVRSQEIDARLKAANARLAEAIMADPRWSPEVEATTREIEAAAAELQRATLQHVFEMRDGLDPEHRKAYDEAVIAALNRGAR